MKTIKQMLLLALATGLGLGLVGCQPSDPSSPKVATLSSIVVAPSSATLQVGAMQSLAVIATFSDGSTRDVSFTSTFASSDTSVATVSATGVVTAVKTGTARITATNTSKTATATVTVAPLRVVSIAVTPAPFSLAPAGTQQLTVTGTFNDASKGDVTAGSTFVSDDTDVATVSASGLVTAVADGAATITATHTASGKTATSTVTVSAGAGVFSTITFDDPAVTYTLTGFGGAEDSTVVDDPTNAANKVAKVVKSATAELWAGTTVSTGPNNTVGTIPFTAANTKMTVRVWSPDAGIPVRLKVEDAADPTHSAETEATTTVAGGWQTLTFDFANPAAGTQPLNLAWTYNRVSIFFNFGTTGAVAGAKTYYFDDVTFN